jgi:dihydrolipoamide dehydrogenase
MGHALEDEDGFVKLLVDPATGEILGCHVLGHEASTLIHEVVVAMRAGEGTIENVTGSIHVHPALNEVVQRAAGELTPPSPR